jgi:hypothetical protein
MRIVPGLLAFLALSVLFMFGASPGSASAQSNDANIQAGLCTGADLTVTANPSSSACVYSTDAATKINNLVAEVINILSAVVGIVAVIMIIVGGLRYVTSGGNDSSVTGAKNTILYAVIGLIIVALSQLIVRFVLSKVTTV